LASLAAWRTRSLESVSASTVGELLHDVFTVAASDSRRAVSSFAAGR